MSKPGRKAKAGTDKLVNYPVKLTKAEETLLKHAAEALGYPSISSYVKAKALDKIKAEARP